MSLSYLSLTEEVVHRADAFAKVTMTRDSGSVPPSAFVLPSLLTAHRKDAAWEDAALAGRPRVRLHPAGGWGPGPLLPRAPSCISPTLFGVLPR